MMTNGQTTTQTPEELAVKSAVEHHVASYARVTNERDELLRQVAKLEQQITVNKIEIEALRGERSTAVSRMESYQHERDDAVANLAVYQTLFIAFNGLLRTFGIEHAPLVKKATAPDAVP
jgi:predicted site-specific integrase-resolvase